MKIIQVLPCLGYGDAVGNDVIAIHKLLIDRGHDAYILCEVLDSRLMSDKTLTINEVKTLEGYDLIIYHLSIGWKYIDLVVKTEAKKICIYHNITPADYYKEYNMSTYIECHRGRKEVEILNNVFDMAICDSEFNKEELIELGYKCPIYVVPILIAFDDYKKSADEKTIAKYSNKPGSKILFTGRVVPNKKFEDIIRVFYLYKKYYDSNASLFLVGMNDKKDKYYKRLKKYCEELKVNDVFFSGHVSFSEILAYYKLADAFLCMSEHEGFCVPLVEAMVFEVPIIAYDAGAVKSTMGDSGIVIKEKNYLEIAGLLNKVVRNEEYKQSLINSQSERLKFFDNDVVSKQLVDILNI